MSEPNVAARYFKLLAPLNTARLVPSRIVMSPEVFYDLQTEMEATSIGRAYVYSVDPDASRKGVRGYIFGIEVMVDPRLEETEAHLEIDL